MCEKYLIIVQEVFELFEYLCRYLYIGPLKYVGLWKNMLFFESVEFMTFKVPQVYV